MSDGELHDILDIDREIAKRGLVEFVEQAWPILDPGEKLIPNWHMDAIGEHLDACRRGQIRRLLINVPPGTSKSTLTAVYFPAWLWGPCGWPEARFIGASYESTLATRDSRKTRTLIDSEWYQERWPIRLVTDQNEKTFFENERRGFRQSCPVSSMTGKRAHFVVWDDPHSPEGANSEVERANAIRIFRETLPTRLVSPSESVIIIIMQRLHQADVSGHILASDLGYDHLCLPMEYEPERKCVTSIGWSDPRTEPGELLFPARFPREVVERDRKVMGEYAYAGQYQQRPAPRGGGMFHVDKIRIVEAPPLLDYTARSWDLASSEQAGDWTAGVKLGLARSGEIVISDMRRDRLSADRVLDMIEQTARLDGHGTFVTVPKDPGQASATQVQVISRRLMGQALRIVSPTTSKESRAAPFASQVNAGNVIMVQAPWNAALIDELASFPTGSNDDQIDALSDAFDELCRVSSAGVWSIPMLAAAEMEPASVPKVHNRIIGIAAPGTADTATAIVEVGETESGMAVILSDRTQEGPDWTRVLATVAQGAQATSYDKELARAAAGAGVRVRLLGNTVESHAHAVGSLYRDGRVMHAGRLGPVSSALLATSPSMRPDDMPARARAVIAAVAAVLVTPAAGASRQVAW